ncbi:MAG: [ribosomal protein S5]-alanine N-acetyltransferase [Actinomycetota bacterium]|nr:[ribosomal protein S5]-alanine N-acetyltransferase [Actinomycetota bacterium]
MTSQDAAALLEVRTRNKAFFEPWEPAQSARHFTLQGQREEIERAAADTRRDMRYAFGIFLKENDQLIGRVALSNVSRGAWQNATLGYYMDEAQTGHGYATEAVRLALQFAFGPAGLHRVQAAVLPRNIASRRVLEKAGFSREGRSTKYLQINGVWEDHEMFAITREDWREDPLS